MLMSLRSHPDDVHDSMLPLRVVNPLALLPVFASACNLTKFLDPRTHRKDVEFSDVLGFITTGTPSDVMMASVALPRRSLRLWGLEPSDPRDIFTVRLNSDIPYTCNKVRPSEENDFYILSWIMSRESANGVETVHLMYSGLVVVFLSMDEVSFSDLSKNQWDSWLRRSSFSQRGVVKVRRVERQESCDLIFDVSRDHVDVVGSNELFVRSGQHCDHSIEVANCNPGNGQTQVIHLPYPIECVRGSLKMDGVKEVKFEVRKAKYSTESLFLADSQNKISLFETTNVPLPYVEWLVPQRFSPNELLRSGLGKIHWTVLITCKGVASSIFKSATGGVKEPIYLQSDDEETSKTQSLMLFVGAVRRDECTGNLAVDVKWMHKPRVILPCAMRNEMDWPSHPPMTPGEFQAVLKMLEVRSEHKPKTEEIRSGAEFMIRSQAVWREFPRVFESPIWDILGDQNPEDHTELTDRMHLLSGGRIGYATLTAMMWPGQVAFIEREGNSLMTNVDMSFDECVSTQEGWLKRGREHGRHSKSSYALLAYEQGAVQGLLMMRTGKQTIKTDALIECLLEAATIRLAERDRKDYPLISACCNKAIELVGNPQSCLRLQAEKLLSKALDVDQLNMPLLQ